AANFFLTDGQQNNSGFLAPGTYSVAEVNIPSGWTLSSAVCSDGSPANAISLQPGETVTCIFTNTQQGQIIVQKQTLPDGSAQSFEFDPSYAANFFLTDGQQNNSGFLAPGIYSVAEVNIPSGWTLSSAVCSDGSPVSAVSLQPGEIVTCVFTNTQKNEIIVIGPDKSPTVPAPVLIVDKDTGAIVNSFLAYEPTFVGGTRVATGDLTGDGIDEIITAPGRGRAPEVRVFTQAGVELPQFRTLAYAATYVGGVHVAVGDVNGDGLNDIITSPSSGKVLVKVFLNQIPNVDPIANVPFKSFYAFPTTFVGGGFVRAADMGLRLGSGTFVNTLDGKAEIIVGSGPGIKAAVKVFHVNGTPTAVRTVFPFSTASSVYKNGVNLDVARLNADLIPDIIVGTENGGNSRVETFVWNGSAALVKTGSFMAYGDSPSKIAPVRVAALDASGDGIADKLATVQGPGGTTQQIRCFDIVSPNPLSVTQTAALGGFPGPYWIAALDSPAPPPQPIEAEGEADFEASALSVTSAPNLDVNGDGAVTAQDALLVVNGLNQQSAGTSLTTEQVKALDVSGDGQLTALDALLLVNELNRTAAAVAALAPAISSATSSSQSDESRFTAEVDELFALL
ncbi:MAG TPA: FG-GAP-like repeat-containing protein, partial [Pirellulaceae bacterium]|nr:FG-GAP-like repeat-containing protein [Pirellulaceae bacterium]